mmetsp:Transcript_45565/g.73444  ORF Transcript_45565/g.73444 Transcript_45565/m.73444 type:complete len:266 (-) Transcript_45565:142-939(-)
MGHASASSVSAASDAPLELTLSSRVTQWRWMALTFCSGFSGSRNIPSTVKLMLSASKGHRPFCKVPLQSRGARYTGVVNGIEGNCSRAMLGGVPHEMFIKVEFVLPQLAPGHLMLWSSALQDTHWFGHRPHTCCDGFGHICCARACGIIASASQTTNMPLPRACAVVGRCLQGGLPCARHPVHLHGCVCQASCWSPSIVRNASPSLPAGSDISPHPAASPAHRQFAEFGRTPAPSASAAIWAAQRDWSSSWMSVTSSRRGVRMMR